jgi:hypothetical protein
MTTLKCTLPLAATGLSRGPARSPTSSGNYPPAGGGHHPIGMTPATNHPRLQRFCEHHVEAAVPRPGPRNAPPTPLVACAGEHGSGDTDNRRGLHEPTADRSPGAVASPRREPRGEASDRSRRRSHAAGPAGLRTARAAQSDTSRLACGSQCPYQPNVGRSGRWRTGTISRSLAVVSEPAGIRAVPSEHSANQDTRNQDDRIADGGRE